MELAGGSEPNRYVTSIIEGSKDLDHLLLELAPNDRDAVLSVFHYELSILLLWARLEAHPRGRRPPPQRPLGCPRRHDPFASGADSPP